MLKTRVNIGNLYYDGWTFFKLKDVFVGDNKNDTLFYVSQIRFDLSGMDFDTVRVVLDDIQIDKALCKITTYPDSSSGLDVLTRLAGNDTSTHTAPFRLYLHEIKAQHSRFVFLDSTTNPNEPGFHYGNMQFSDAFLHIRHFNLIGDSLHFQVKELKTIEKSGLEILHFKTIATISSHIMEFRKLDFETPHSQVGNYFAMRYDGWDGIGRDFMREVKLEAHIRNSHVHMKDVKRFAYGNLDRFHYDPQIEVDVTGTVANLKIKHAKVKYGNSTVFRGDCKINGLPDIDQTYFELVTHEASTDTKELEELSGEKMPKWLHQKLGKISYKGTYTGFIQDFVSFGELTTDYGKIRTDFNMKLSFDKPMESSYSGSIASDNFDLGNFLDQKDLKYISFDWHGDGKGLNPEKAILNSQTTITYIDYNRYRYTASKLSMHVNHKFIQFKLNSTDPAADIDLSGTCNFQSQWPAFVFKSNVNQLDLKKLNFTDRDIRLSTQAKGDFELKSLDRNKGHFVCENSDISVDNKDYTINHLEINSVNDFERIMEVKSDFMQALIKGKFQLEYLPKHFQHIIHTAIPNYVSDIKENLPNEDFIAHVNIRNGYVLSALFFPEWDIDKLEMKAEMQSIRNQLDLRLYAEMIRFKSIYFNELTCKLVQSKNDEIALYAGMNRLLKNDSLLMKDWLCKITLQNNSALFHSELNDSLGIIHANWTNHIQFEPKLIRIGFDHSSIRYNNTLWKVADDSKIHYRDSSIRFEQLQFQNGMQLVNINGNYTNGLANQHVLISLSDFSLNNLNTFGIIPKIDINGNTNGNIILDNDRGRTTVNSNLEINDLMLDKDSVGDFRISSNYDQLHQRISFDAEALRGKLNNFKANGYVWLNDAMDLDIHVGVDDASVTAFNAFGKDYFSLLGGYASLNASISGNISKPIFSGEVNLKNVYTKILYLQTIYHSTAKIVLNENEIKLIPTQLFDQNQHAADLKGRISHNYFSQFNFDISIDNFKQFEMLNTQSKDNDLYYGKAFGSGYVNIHGPLNDIILDVDAASDKGTKIILTPFGLTEADEDKLIHFVQYDSTQAINRINTNDLSGFTINMNVHLMNDAEMEMILDDQSDDKIKATGTGDLKLLLARNGEFNMYGNANLTKGEYRFTAMNLVSRKFDLYPGSSISWNGDPFQANLNITGVYQTRTSVSELVNVSSQVSASQRMLAECLLSLNGKLESPIYKFDLNFPETESQLSGTAANELTAVINNLRKDQDNMTQQVISLLVFGKFTPLANVSQNAGSGINISNRALSDLASGQINSILGKVAPGIDFSVDMQNTIDPSKGRSLLLSASHKFFDNRLELQGTVATDNSQNNFIAQYNISQNGNFKARLFNRYALNPIYDRNITTQGVGLFYRKEFNTFFKDKKNNGK